MRRILLSGSLAAVFMLILSGGVSASAATTVPCDSSRVLTPITSLPDNTYGRMWEQHYGLAQVSYFWTKQHLTTKVGAVRVDELKMGDKPVAQPVRSFWIRSTYNVCRNGRLDRVGYHRLTATSWGSGVIPLKQTLVDNDYFSAALMRKTWVREGLWLTSRVTLETVDGKRSSVRTTIRVLPPERL